MSPLFSLSIFFTGFIFTFAIQIFWGRLLNKFGGLGGFLAGTFISGSIWIIGHGIKNPLIYQSGSIWIDMAWAPAVGALTFSFLQGHKIKQSFSNFFAAISGGFLAGMLIYVLN